MKAIKLILLLALSISLTNCEDNNKKEFPINKRYWTVDDYDDVTRTLRFGYEPDEELPSFDNPETRIIVEKFTDPQNYLVILDDKDLGVEHRNKIAQKFFNKWQDMINVYNVRDKKDNFIYEKEMLKVYHFGLGLQIRYFALGNEGILKNSDTEESARNTINSNIQNLIENFQLYLDFINDEKSFSDEGKKLFSDGLVKYYTELIEKFPNADYRSTKFKMEALKKKAQSETIKKALDKVIALINEKERIKKQ